MLDKSIPYIDVLMQRKKGVVIPAFPLPEGFNFVFYKPGDAQAWAKIEMSVLEFDNEAAALERFQKFADMPAEAERRCVFIENPQGEKIATTTAWWEYTGVRRDPWLHWVAVMPEYQGLGLGKAIVSHVMRLMAEIEGDRNFYLHTQTWSHKAIRIYKQLGWEITDEQGLWKYTENPYDKAIAALDEICRIEENRIENK